AQFYRDSRISPIYEGTNGIQAIDLVMRKLTLSDGEPLRQLLDDIEETVESLGDADPDLAERLGTALAAARHTSDWLVDRLENGSYDDALAGATPFLDLMGTLTGGWLMARSRLAAQAMIGAGEGDKDFLQAKLTTTEFYLRQILPRVTGLEPAVTGGADALASFG
ncbi:MAG: acyl-CoA dehydrogenase, partial [Acidimicrobiia bacterium]